MGQSQGKYCMRSSEHSKSRLENYNISDSEKEGKSIPKKEGVQCEYDDPEINVLDKCISLQVKPLTIIANLDL